MLPIFDLVQLTHPKLQEFAVMAAWISVLAETVRELEDLNIDLSPEERELPDFSTPWPWEFDAVSLAQLVVQGSRDQGVQLLEEQLTAWLGEDRENWPVFRLALIDLWQERPGLWSVNTLGRVRTLGTIAATAQAQHN